MHLKKVTIGFVIQTYDTDLGMFISQEFIAGDQVDWEYHWGVPVNDAHKALYQLDQQYQSFGMEEPGQ